MMTVSTLNLSGLRTAMIVCLCAAAILFVVACSDDGDPVPLGPAQPPAPINDTSDTPSQPDDVVGPAPEVVTPDPVVGVPCALNARVGHVEVAHRPFADNPAYASVTAEIAEGVIPLTILQPYLDAGDCRLMRKVNPFCDPACGAGELCEHDGGCIPYPENKNVGTITVTGLEGGELAIEPNVVNYYNGQGVPFPAFGEGDPITIFAAGGDLEGFTLSASGVPDLVLPDEGFVMEQDKPLEVTWPAAPGGAWTVRFSFNIDQHGNSPVTMFCDVEDTGSYVVSAEIINALIDAGVSGFASANFERHTLDSTELSAGCVQLSVFSTALGSLQLEGHTACFSDFDCPEGQVCEVLINTCVPQ